MKRWLAAFILATVSSAVAIGQASFSVPNASTTGTTLNTLATIGTTYAATIATTGNTAVPTYIVAGGDATGLLSGTYTSGITTTGTTGQTCILTMTNGGGLNAAATVALTGTNTIAGGTALVVTVFGTGYTSAPTSASVAAGTAASCTGTAVVSTVIGSVPTTVGSAILAFGGQALCTFDASNASGAGGWYVIASTTTGGDCHTQTAAPSNGTWIVGYLDSASTVSGSTALVNVVSGFYNASAGTVTTTGSPSSGQMGAFSGSTSITAATAANLGSLVNLAQYDVVYSGGTAAALSGLAGNTSATPEFVTSTGTGSAAQAPTLTSSTGSGNVVLATSPTLVTPALGTPASGVITNLTGTCASCNIGGTAANASTVANTGAQNANATYYFCFLAANTSTQQACNTSAGFTVNPSTGAVTLSGSGASNVAIGSAGSATGTLTLESATATGGVTLSPAPAASQVTVTVPAATDTLVNLGSAQTLTSKTLTSPVINTGVTGTAVQGTDTLLMSAGTVAGTGASLCTDANGGATTSGCSGSSFPTGSTNQTLRFSGTNTGGATSAITVLGSAATSNVGIDQTAPIQQLEISGPIQQDVPFTGTVTFAASCSATAINCTISGGANLNATGGVILASYNSGSSDGEYICYSAATSTTLTIGGGNCGTPVTTNGRSYWGSTAAVHPNGEQIAQVLEAVVASVTSTPARIALGNGGVGGVCFGSCPATQFSHVAGVQSGSTLYALAGGGIGFSASPSANGGNSVLLDSGGGTALVYVNSSNNAGLVAGQAGLSYNLTTQSITGNGTLTAITNATTAVFPNNNTAAAAGTGGVLGSICTIAWNQATSGTVQFGLKASAAPTDLWVLEEDLGAVATVVTPSQTATTITGTTTTATSAAIGPIAFGTTYFSKIYLRMNPGTSNSVSVQLYASASANTLTIEPGTGCSAWQ